MHPAPFPARPRPSGRSYSCSVLQSSGQSQHCSGSRAGDRWAGGQVVVASCSRSASSSIVLSFGRYRHMVLSIDRIVCINDGLAPTPRIPPKPGRAPTSGPRPAPVPAPVPAARRSWRHRHGRGPRAPAIARRRTAPNHFTNEHQKDGERAANHHFTAVAKAGHASGHAGATAGALRPKRRLYGPRGPRVPFDVTPR